MRGETAVIDAMETRVLPDATWHEAVEHGLLRIFKIVVWLSSAYLSVCYGIPAEAMEFLKERI